jgi:hypothetical protein
MNAETRDCPLPKYRNTEIPNYRIQVLRRFGLRYFPRGLSQWFPEIPFLLTPSISSSFNPFSHPPIAPISPIADLEATTDEHRLKRLAAIG